MMKKLWIQKYAFVPSLETADKIADYCIIVLHSSIYLCADLRT